MNHPTFASALLSLSTNIPCTACIVGNHRAETAKIALCAQTCVTLVSPCVTLKRRVTRFQIVVLQTVTNSVSPVHPKTQKLYVWIFCRFPNISYLCPIVCVGAGPVPARLQTVLYMRKTFSRSTYGRLHSKNSVIYSVR